MGNSDKTVSRRKFLTSTGGCLLAATTPNLLLAQAIKGEDCYGGRELPTSAGGGGAPAPSGWKKFLRDWAEVQRLVGKAGVYVGGAAVIGGIGLTSVTEGAAAPAGAFLVSGGSGSMLGGAMSMGGADLLDYIASDPPRPNYRTYANCSTGLARIDIDLPPQMRPFVTASAQVYRSAAVTLAALELYQGALAAEDQAWVCTHDADYRRASADLLELAYLWLTEVERLTTPLSMLTQADIDKLNGDLAAADTTRLKRQLRRVTAAALSRCESERSYAMNALDNVMAEPLRIQPLPADFDTTRQELRDRVQRYLQTA